MSRPYALPVGPTRRAESSTSMPPPEPRSSTVSPSRSSASAVGLPHPSDASTASGGRIAVSASLYRLAVIGSSLDAPHDPPPQQGVLDPAAAWVAALPYRSRTVAFRLSVLILSS